MVDLAGSERVVKTGAEGDRLKVFDYFISLQYTINKIINFNKKRKEQVSMSH